jgi:hypothetical protein
MYLEDNGAKTDIFSRKIEDYIIDTFSKSDKYINELYIP